MSSLISFIIIICLAIVGVSADYFIKLSGNSEKYIIISYFFIGMVIYALTAFGWFYVMKNTRLSVLGIIYSVSTSVLLLMIGVIFFKEQLTVYNVIGVVLGIISIIFLFKFS
ncbi:EamA family transporter [Patescibacteria group bacterium]|nr:EamA family transporter [Patescibacteria group bacterium]